MPNVDERARRRSDFLGGVPVRMADGQEWILPKPRVRFAPSDDGFAVVLAGAGDAFNAVSSAYYAALDRPMDDERNIHIIRAELDLAMALIQRNYDVTPQEMAGVLQFSYDETDEEAYRIREQTMDVALGRGKKPLGATSE